MAVIICLLIAFTGCEKKQSSIIDPNGYAPLLTAPLVAPDSVNLTNLPSGTTTVTFAVSARVTHPGGSKQISQVTSSLTTEGSTDPIATIILRDDGQSPDRAPDDSIYSGQLTVSVQDLLVGSYFCQVSAFDVHGYSSTVAMIPVSISQVNYPPSLSQLQVPDTIVLGGQSQQFTLSVRATDPNGLSDIAKVQFNSYKPNGDPAKGNPYPMYDDGGINSASGDAVKGDGIYTLTIRIDPTDANGNPTPLGGYRFEFQAIDRSNASSPILVHTIQVVQ